MIAKHTKSIAILAVGFAAGLTAAWLPISFASDKAEPIDLSKKEFMISVDEIKQNFVFGESFKGSYSKSVNLSDGSTRTIKLTPMIHKGVQVVELNDTGGVTYMGMNGTTTNGKLMVQLRNMEELRAQLEAQGWVTKPK